MRSSSLSAISLSASGFFHCIQKAFPDTPVSFQQAFFLPRIFYFHRQLFEIQAHFWHFAVRIYRLQAEFLRFAVLSLWHCIHFA